MNHLKNTTFQLLLISFILLNATGTYAQVLFKENNQNWIIKGDVDWKFNNNELIGNIIEGSKGSGFVMTKQTYNDFILEMEFKPDSTINSGVFIRCKNYEINSIDCFEINIWDLHPNQEYRTGAIVTKTKPLAIVQTIDKWNTYKIKTKNDHIQVWVNGILTADTKDKSLSEGYIGLQAMGTGEIRFRNVKIKAL